MGRKVHVRTILNQQRGLGASDLTQTMLAMCHQNDVRREGLGVKPILYHHRAEASYTAGLVPLINTS
ncbi:MAG: hypothetical protein OXC62_04930, partial [Aestuariivita sp.]|nr:hypothetical protein [Aestuariivita sp.]